MVNSIRKNKRGWIRILEATIAVMIVSGVLVVVYSKQVDRGIAPAEYFFSLQRQILADIAIRSDLRLAVLNTYNDSEPADGNFTIIYDFVNTSVPDAFGFSLRVCSLGDVCKRDIDTYKATMGKDVFVEDLVISSELGNGADAVYNKGKKLIFFVWEKR